MILTYKDLLFRISVTNKNNHNIYEINIEIQIHLFLYRILMYNVRRTSVQYVQCTLQVYTQNCYIEY